MSEKKTAIVLAAGQGKRMQSAVHKQYLLLKGKPVLFYCLKTFEESFIDEIILVTGKGEEEYCRKEIVERFQFKKVSKIVEGGKERYHSVINGIKAIEESRYVFIHDGARPFLSADMLERALQGVKAYHACVTGMPVKDTIKIADEKGFANQTLRRDSVWMIQTPQVFDFTLIKNAYKRLEQEEDRLKNEGVMITDDAMVVEYFTDTAVKLVEGSYQNIKITTPEDLAVAQTFAAKESLLPDKKKQEKKLIKKL